MEPIGFQLKTLHNYMVRGAQKIGREYQISGVQFIILDFLMENRDRDIYQKDIEKLVNIRGSTATKILQNLTKKGYIDRIATEGDARKKKIVLSDKVQVLMEEFKVKMASYEKSLEEGITDEEKEQFSAIVEKIKKNLEKEK